LRIERRETGERGVQIEQVDVSRVALGDSFVEGHPRPSARSLGRPAAPGVIHQDPAHHL
jgi:hypothetical protein